MTTTPSPPGIDLTGYALAFAGATLFASKGIFIKLAFAAGVSTEATMALRMFVSLPVYLAILVVLLRRDPRLLSLLKPRTLISAMAVGALGYYVSSYLDFAGLAYVSAQYERLVLFTYPFFVVLLGVWFFGEPMKWALIPAMLITYAGILILFVWNLSVSPDGLLIGTILVLCAAVTFALYQHLARSQMKLLGAGLFTCIGMSTAGVLAIGQSLIMDGPATYFGFTPYVWLVGLMLGVLATVLPSFLINTAISRIGPRATSSTSSFGPVATIVLAVIVLGEDFTLVHAVGTAVVLAGCWLFARTDSRTG